MEPESDTSCTTQAAWVPSAIDGVVVREFVEIPENSTHPTELPLVTLVPLMVTPPNEAVGVIPSTLPFSEDVDIVTGPAMTPDPNTTPESHDSSS